VLLVILILAPVPRAYPVMLIAPHIALDSAVACRVFRGIKLGYLSDADTVASKYNSMRFAQRAATSTGSSTKCEGRLDDLEHPRDKIVVKVTRETECAEPRDNVRCTVVPFES
jgi:hypothetical protein